MPFRNVLLSDVIGKGIRVRLRDEEVHQKLMIFKLMLGRWYSQPMKLHFKNCQPIREGLSDPYLEIGKYGNIN